MEARLLPCGERAVLVELPDLGSVLALHAAVGRAAWARVVDVVPASRTLLVTVDAPGALEPVRAGLAALAARIIADPHGPSAPSGPTVEIPVVYDGPDLAEVGRLTGLGPEGVVAAHTGTPWTVAFGGFAPGFGYLVGGDPRLAVPRRDRPRPRIEPGSVGLAGEYSGVYPSASPGGWQLIGRTEVVLWDLDREPPALLEPGTTVRFVRSSLPSRTRSPSRSSEREGSDAVPSRRPAPATLPPEGSRRALHVLEPGPLCLVEDAGRPGWARLGVGSSGAADRSAYALGERLVGNPPGRAALEVLLGGLTARAEGDLLVALTGARCPASVDGVPIGHAAPVHLPDGTTLRLGAPRAGLRTYLSVRGGLLATPVLGSCSRDVLAGIGPAPVVDGSTLGVGGVDPAMLPGVDQAPVADPSTGVVELDLLPGPRSDRLADPAALEGMTWRVGADSNRVGVRLAAEGIIRLTRHTAPELPSEGLVPGSVQLPPGGEIVVFLADHPVTGGYPTVAVLTDASVDRAAQLRPGQPVRLRWHGRTPGAAC